VSEPSETMKIKTSDLTDAALDWAVGEALRPSLQNPDRLSIGSFGPLFGKGYAYPSWRCKKFSPSTVWSEGGPIIEREELSVEPLYTAGGLDCWRAYGHNLRYTAAGDYIQGSDNRQYGPTPLIAAMRCFVASKLGDEVEVPDELLQHT
jgi:hypothetical protein